MMPTINGVAIELYDGEGKKLEIEPDGHVGKLEAGTARLVLKVAPGSDNVHVFLTDGTGKVQLKKNETPASRIGEVGRMFRLNIPIVPLGDGSYAYTKYPYNVIRLLDVGSGGAFAIWEISLISQHGEFFLVANKTTESKVLHRDSGMVCPALDFAPHVRGYVCQQYAERRSELASAEDTPETVMVDEFQPYMGRVLWWSTPQGFGAILTLQGEARVHWTQVRRLAGKRAYLIAGEVVKFVDLKAPHQSGRPTRFTLEAVGVTPIF